MQPRYYQQEANDAAWDFMRNESGNPLIVLPTGAGKSLVVAMLVKQAIEYNARVIILQHRKELIRQNMEKVKILIPDADIGFYSAGLKRKEIDNDIIGAGIQSIYSKATELGRRELVIIDEVHLVGGEETMYGKFLSDLQAINTNARLVGLTATPFRTGEGPICGSDKIFQRICYEAQTGRLISEGFLCPVTNKPAESGMVDTSSIRVQGGEFVYRDAEQTFNTDDNVTAACNEMIARCNDRNSILIFSSGVNHAEAIADHIRKQTGEEVGLVTGDTFAMERDRLLADFGQQKLRWLVNCDVLTTGFDAPCIDAIGVMRATMSPGLFAQIVGRGLRMHPSKTECLIMDFGENIKRHGSLDDPNYGRASVERRGKGQATIEKNGRGKECIACGLDVAANARICPECGFAFPVNHEAQADSESTITGQAPPQQWDVVGVSWYEHKKKKRDGKPPTLRIEYVCHPAGEPQHLINQKTIKEWVCIEHEGFANRKARQWWSDRSIAEFPESVEEATQLLDRGVARCPARIETVMDGKWPRVQSPQFIEEIPLECDWLPEENREYAWVDDAFDDVPFEAQAQIMIAQLPRRRK